MTRRVCFALDLVDNADAIAGYEEAHRPGGVWPEIVDHIRAQGVEAMQIWRRVDRLLMICDVAADYPRPTALEGRAAQWEAAMTPFQRPLLGQSVKWTPMVAIFDLADHAGLAT